MRIDVYDITNPAYHAYAASFAGQLQEARRNEKLSKRIRISQLVEVKKFRKEQEVEETSAIPGDKGMFFDIYDPLINETGEHFILTHSRGCLINSFKEYLKLIKNYVKVAKEHKTFDVRLED